MALPGRMRFGIFLAPFHPLGENPTLALERDLDLLQWLDHLGFDEAWIGEHHSAGWEIIPSPEIFIATAAERTRHLRLGTGVVSLPYHHPLMVANRLVLLDHLTRGRVMLGVGPGALVSDAYMLGIDPTRQRARMDEALGVIIRLLTETEPFTYESDWFTLREATLQLRPYTQPHFPIAVASAQSPAGMEVAGKYGLSVLSFAAYMGIRGLVDLPRQWQIAEETAARYGKRVHREEWRLVIPMHLAESRQGAMDQARAGAARWLVEYFGDTLGRPVPRHMTPEQVVEKMVADGAWVIGTPEDAIAAIERYGEISGGFGGLLLLAHEWAPREQTWRSYELFARYVMPRFQGALAGLSASNSWAQAHSAALFAAQTQAIEQAHAAYAQRQTSR